MTTQTWVGWERVCIFCHEPAPLTGCEVCCTTATKIVRKIYTTHIGEEAA